MNAKSKQRRLRRAASMAEVLDSCPELLRLGLQDGERQIAILAKWETVVGTPVARNTQPLKFSKGVLEVAVATPAWMHNLAMMKTQILANFEKELGRGVVRDLKFKIADFDLQTLKGARDA